MKTLTASHITYKQREILDLLYKHRFLTRIHLQTFLKHKDKKTIYLWLKDLRVKGYIDWIYNKDHFAEKTKPAIYYLTKTGINHFRQFDYYNETELRKRYREHERSQTFIDRCLVIADPCITLMQTRQEDDYPHTYYFNETEADYQSDSYYHFLSDNEYIHPNLCFSKEEYDGLNDPHAIESYLLEIFDATLTRYRLNYRLRKYIEYLDEEMGEWEEETFGDPNPIILLVCATTTDLIYAKRSTRRLMADIWEYGDEERPHVRFTTIKKLRQNGVTAVEIWEEA